MENIERDTWWDEHFLPHGKAKDSDFVSRDGTTIVEVKKRLQGLRGLYAGVMELALALNRNPVLKRACLVIDATDVSLNRLQSEWTRVRQSLRDDIGARLSLVVLGEDDSWIDPDEPFIEEIRLAFLRNTFRATQDRLVRVRPAAGQRFFEIVKILLNRWLRNEEPVSIGELAKEVGSTYPTIRDALRRLESKKYLAKESGRFVRLTRFPQETWRELVALAPTLRRPLRFIDESGETPNPDRLLDRLKTIHPKRIALGGVVAARYWNPDFDLHGTPRLDLVAHAPDNVADLRFLKRLDPALKQTDDPEAAAALVIHPLIRSKAMFTEVGPNTLPYTDPVETVLDLQELGLTQQANQLLSHFRKEIR
jgi:DNA-binding MarR family transcriptional regulator